MMTEIALDSLSVAEKVQLLERVWESLCSKPAEFESPAWHGDLLAERQRRLEANQATVSSWSDAKARLLRLGQ